MAVICATIAISCILLGGMLGRSTPINNSSNAENNVTINQEIPKNFENNSKVLKKNENFSKKININNCSFYDLLELKGVGKKKAENIIKNRPYSHTKELLEKNILGYYSYEKNKHLIKVDD